MSEDFLQKCSAGALVWKPVSLLKNHQPEKNGLFLSKSLEMFEIWFQPFTVSLPTAAPRWVAPLLRSLAAFGRTCSCWFGRRRNPRIRG